jgi:hypothetical protein
VNRCRASWKSGYGQEALGRFLDAFLVLTRGSRNNLQTSVPGFSSPTPQKRAKVTMCLVSKGSYCTVLPFCGKNRMEGRAFLTRSMVSTLLPSSLIPLRRSEEWYCLSSFCSFIPQGVIAKIRTLCRESVSHASGGNAQHPWKS